MGFPILPRWNVKLITPAIAAFLMMVSLGMIYSWQANLWPTEEGTRSIYWVHSHAAAGMFLAALSLALQRTPLTEPSSVFARMGKTLAQLLALLIILLGALTLTNDFSGIGNQIDQNLREAGLEIFTFRDGSMSMLSAICFILAGTSLLLLDSVDRNGRYIAEYATIGIAALMSAPLIGHLYAATEIIHMPSSLSVPIQAPIFFLLLVAGILFSRPTHQLMTIFLSDAPGGLLLRRLLPTALIFLICLDLLVELGARQGFYAHDKVSPLLVLVDTALLSLLFWRTAFLLNNEYVVRIQGEAELAKTNDILRIVSDSTSDVIFVKDRKGRYIFANPSTLKLMNKDLASTIGRTNKEIFSDQEDVSTMDDSDQRVMSSGQAENVEQAIHHPDSTRFFYTRKSPWKNKYGEILGVVGIATDITERKQAEDALKAHEAQLEAMVVTRTAEVSELIGHLQTTREEEKRAIARELHDDLGSSLTALNMHMAIIFKKMANDPTLTERAMQIKALLNSVTATTRRIQNGLRPDKLDIFGIKTTIAEQAAEFENYTGVACKTNLPDENISYQSDIEITLFRIVQEALNNIAKHAKATQVEIILDDNEEYVSLTIRDNGVGISDDNKKNYHAVHGLRGMRERATYLGGGIDIISAPGKGTKITVTFPKETEAATTPAPVSAERRMQRDFS